MSAFLPAYIGVEDLVRYTRGKIVVGEAVDEFSEEFLEDICAKGESVVERDLNKLYQVPFENLDGGDYASLPASTRAYLENLFTLQAVILLLTIAFGGNSAVLGGNYLKYASLYYDTEKRKIMSKDKTGLYAHFPLIGLAFNKRSYTGQTTAPTPKVIDPLLGRNNARKAVRRITSVDQAVGATGFGLGQPRTIVIDLDSSK